MEWVKIARSHVTHDQLNMPTQDTHVISSDTIIIKGHKKSKKSKRKKEITTLSRKRYQTELKKSLSIRRFEPPTKSEWVTSGKLGSRDAVLVFRTDIFEKDLSQIDSDTETFTNLSTNIKYKSKSQSTLNTALTKNGGSSNTPKIATVATAAQKKHNSLHKVASVNSVKNLSDSRFSSDNSISSDNCESNENEPLHGKLKAVSSNYSNVTIDSGINAENMNCNQLEVNPNLPAAKLQLKYKFHQTETKLLRKIFTMHGLSEVDGDENFSIFWTGAHMKPDVLRNLAPYQRVNHFPSGCASDLSVINGSDCNVQKLIGNKTTLAEHLRKLTRKDRMYKNIVAMQYLHGLKYFDIVPQSFVLPSEYRDLLSAHKKHKGPWIVKPAASSRGRGIFIVDNPDQIPQDEQGLVSKYITHPLCIDDHKCDVRVYVLVTSVDPLIIYLYEEGLVRIATVKYEPNVDNLWNPCMHLCNYSINKYHSDYVKSNDAHDEDVGNKWTLSALLRHLKIQGCNTQLLMLNIEDLIIKSILSCTQSIIAACRMFVPNGNNCFELYGFDILIDNSLKPWLLEINLSPSMGVDSPLDTKVKASMITDLLTCIGIPAYSATMREHYDTKWTRFKNNNHCGRRTCSADSNNSGGLQANVPKRTNAQTIRERNANTPLTVEDQRVIRNARLQNARSGGWVRIFPTEDTMLRYGGFLDPQTGIPMSTPTVQGQTFISTVVQHNYNQMLFNNLYGRDANDKRKQLSSLSDRMAKYERALENTCPIPFNPKICVEKSVEEGKRLRKEMLKLIDGGSEFTQFQVRKIFAFYLQAVLRRLTDEPRDSHEKLLLKFLERIGGISRMPSMMRRALTYRGVSKAKSAMVAKLLGDFIDQYIRDTEAYVDSFEFYGMIPTDLFSEFLKHANEGDLEAVLALHTNRTGNMPYLYNRYALSLPPTPPIPSGLHGFLRALPAMVSGNSAAREFNKYDGYIKFMEKETERLPDVAVQRKLGSKKY